jgi:hypothetical protein
MSVHASVRATGWLAAAAFSLVACQSAWAARLLKAEIEVDGKVVLQTAYSDRGTESPATVWRYLGDEPGWADTAMIQPNESDPQRARLVGNIVIRVQHGGSPLVEARASELELIRVGSPNDRWYLPEAEVERIAAANGIGPPSNSSKSPLHVGMWLAVGGTVVILGLVVLLGIALAVRRPSRAAH